MKVIKYYISWDTSRAAVTMGYNEANLEVAKREADNGEYAIEEVEGYGDDGHN